MDKAQILLVEDDSIFRQLIAKILQGNGYEVIEADNGAMALSVFQSDPGNFKLIVSDIQMPEMDGVSFLKQVRLMSNIPFIIMTGFSEILDSQSACDKGANGFLCKPVRAMALLEEIKICLQQSDKSKGTSKPKIDEYKKILLENFLLFNALPSDVYFSLGPDHLIRIAGKGDTVSPERLRLFRSNDIKFLYVTIKDYVLYQFKHREAA